MFVLISETGYIFSAYTSYLIFLLCELFFDIQDDGEPQTTLVEDSSPNNHMRKKKPKTTRTGSKIVAPSPSVASTPKEKMEKLTNLRKGEKEVEIARKPAFVEHESTYSSPDFDASKVSLF